MSEFRITKRDPDLDDAVAICAICRERIPLDLILGHLRGVHEIDVEISTWPDGAPVIVDETLTPDDFDDRPDA